MLCISQLWTHGKTKAHKIWKRKSNVESKKVDEVNRRIISEGPKKECDKNAYVSEVLQSNSPLIKKENEPIKEENAMIQENEDEFVTFEEPGDVAHQAEEKGYSLACIF